MSNEDLHDGERRMATVEANNHEVFRRLDGQDTNLTAIRNDVHEIKVAVASYRSFFAGFSFALASLGGIIGAGITAAWDKITGP